MKLVYVFVAVGGLVGGYIPVLFGADGFSLWSILAGAAGGIIGLFVYVKLDLD